MMPAEYEDLVEQGYVAWNGGDRGWVLEHMRPDVEWIPPPDDPDGRPYVGYAGVKEFWDQWRAAVGQLRFEILEMTSYGDDVVVSARRRGKGISSGLEMADEVIQIFSFDEEGKCFRVREFYDRDEAMKVVRGSARG